MDKATEEKIGELQVIEQNLQRFLTQKQQFQTQMVEMDTALNELNSASEAHKIIGNIMVSVDKKKLQEDLKSKKDMLDLRFKSIEKQEQNMRERADNIQKEVMEGIKKEKK
ncbi:MAG: prefoldin subunit [Nanoarchaeota archaeon]|nr:prefoldin subunit [DPANN group archaeon]MBL7116816.1 prefoldin subunit [Nanoarchaeota archaeon]